MKKYILLLFLSLLYVPFLYAQNTITVQGNVTDATTGQPLIGAGVSVKGTSTGTQTDATGAFTLSAPADGTLVVDYLGYNRQEVPINNQTTLNVKLGVNAEQLKEVVVVGYGTQEKRDVTGSISSVKGETIARQATQNPVSALQGKVAGVQITNSGAPGSSPQIRIRGVGSAQGGTQPLYVVDGTFVSDLSFLNPADIESMEILKDASSAAIYGVRAANGVVLVTTKRGAAGQMRVSYNGYVGTQRVTNKLELANAQEYATLINEKQGTNQVGANNPSTDWYDQILRNALVHNHQVMAAGGSDKVTYTLSAGYLNQEGIVKGNDYEKITARLQTDINFTKNIKVGYSAIFYDYKSNDIPSTIFYQAFVAPPVLPIFKANGNYGDPADIGLGDFANPQASLDWYNQKSQGQRLNGNAFAEISFLDALTFRTSLGIDYGIDQYRNYIAADSLTTVQKAQRSTLTKSRSKTTSWLWENTLTYNKTIGDNDITALVGISSQENRSELFAGSANDVPFESEANLYLSLGDPETFDITNTGDRYTFASYFGRVNYSFQDKYLLTATLRYDGSSKFPKSDRWDYFPSIGLGWRVTEESFMKNQTIFDNLKLRASWGKLGNNQIPSNIFTLLVSDPGSYTAVFGGVPSIGRSIASIVPPTLLWENVKETDLGAEMGFLNNRLTLEADWYNKKTENAIFTVPILGSAGLLSNEITGNFATFRNRGFEVVAGWSDNVGDDFSYNLGVNISTNKNEVTELTTGNNALFNGNLPVGGYQVTISRVGDPIGSYYGYIVDGIFQNEQEIAESAQANSGSIAPGDFRYRDLNGDGVIDSRDKTIIGNPNAGLVYGFNSGFTYKSFDLQVDVQGVADVDVYNGNRNTRYGNENYSKDFYDNRWHGAGTSNSYPSADLTGGNLDPNDFYVESGAYVRLRNIQLGYNLPTGVIEKWKMQAFRVYVNAQNAITLFDYNGFSPEIGGSPISQGVDLNVYPLSATYNLGVNVTF
ncbi:SusC/RagA family TonB-linked outer membrane protein [Pontibacter liquoris]|uniref:SusC/RagA family TonB-linked outer membrane protein n=1 Tax=Pontibacter liquoris TaxID=2905677 RepID=UPI001FA745C9|nr:TonB-dependent receptor [Pontibacter liquoris]